METIDNQAREDIGKIWYRVGIIETVLWGADKTNGIRSVTNENTKAIHVIIERLNHYIDSDREKTCVGLAELARRDAEAAENQEEEVEVETAKINANASKYNGKGQVIGMIIVAAIQLCGIIVVALLK